MAAPMQLSTPRGRDADAGDGASAPGATGTERWRRRHRRPSRARYASPCPSRPATARSHLAARRVGLESCTVEPARRRAGALAAVAVTTFAVVCGLALLGQVGTALRETPRETSVVRVGAGETVRDVAERVAPGSDVRAVAERIRRLNGMPGATVEPGRMLRVPDGR